MTKRAEGTEQDHVRGQSDLLINVGIIVNQGRMKTLSTTDFKTSYSSNVFLLKTLRLTTSPVSLEKNSWIRTPQPSVRFY